LLLVHGGGNRLEEPGVLMTVNGNTDIYSVLPAATAYAG
jgi:hypothetical protein